MKRNIIWPAVIAAGLSSASVVAGLFNSQLSVPIGLAGIVSAILATRAK